MDRKPSKEFNLRRRPRLPDRVLHGLSNDAVELGFVSGQRGVKPTSGVLPHDAILGVLVGVEVAQSVHSRKWASEKFEVIMGHNFLVKTVEPCLVGFRFNEMDPGQAHVDQKGNIAILGTKLFCQKKKQKKVMLIWLCAHDARSMLDGHMLAP